MVVPGNSCSRIICRYTLSCRSSSFFGAIMTGTIPDLWGDQVKVDVVTPLAIMRTQGALLKQRTSGLLEIDIQTTATLIETAHKFFVVAPSLPRYSELLFTASHLNEKVYPAFIEAACLSDSETWRADTQNELLDLLQRIFQSPGTRSLLQSLIARSNEVTKPPVVNPWRILDRHCWSKKTLIVAHFPSCPQTLPHPTCFPSPVSLTLPLPSDVELT